MRPKVYTPAEAKREAAARERKRLEDLLACHIASLKLPAPMREHHFHPDRDWRFDFAWPDLLLAAEVDGGTWSGGRHVRGAGYEDGCLKCDEALLLGWRVLRFTARMVEDGCAVMIIERAIRG